MIGKIPVIKNKEVVEEKTEEDKELVQAETANEIKENEDEGQASVEVKTKNQ